MRNGKSILYFYELYLIIKYVKIIYNIKKFNFIHIFYL
jgi:hypothetical protein